MTSETIQFMFPAEIKLEQLNELSKGCMVEHLGIEFIEIGKDYLVAEMPVDSRTTQPMGILHGGASVALAETMGSLATSITLDISKQFPVGLEINANHIKSAKSGKVTGKCTSLHIGKSTQVWEIKIHNDNSELVCVSRITMAILNHKH